MQSSQEVQAAKMTILERPLDGRGVKAVGYQLGLYSLEGSMPGAVEKKAWNILVLSLQSWGPGLVPKCCR